MLTCTGVLLALVLAGCGGGGGGSSSLPAPINVSTGSGSGTAPSSGAPPAGASAPSGGSSGSGSSASGASASASSFSQMANPGPWPTIFRPYCANASPNPSAPCPWNDTLPDNPQQLNPNSAAIVSSLFAPGDIVALPGDWSLGGDYNHAIYFANSSDPLVTVTCTETCSAASASFHIPSKARAAGFYQQSSSSDCHMAIIEPDGSEYDMYEACAFSGQSAFSVKALYKTSILGSGQGSTTDGAALAAGIPRFDEMMNGVVPHALFASTACVSGSFVYPALTQGNTCTSGTGPPMGARLQLTLTDAQINALNLPEQWEYALLHAMHDYGVYILDTSGGSAPGVNSNTLIFREESQTQYNAYGIPYPASSVPGLDAYTAQFDNAIDWAHSFRVVSPCYAQETCSQ
jgi:hypothetical protein